MVLFFVIQISNESRVICTLNLILILFLRIVVCYGKGYYICIRQTLNKQSKNKPMKMKSLLFVALATLGFTSATTAQNLPNYVPANGLVGWWPFNGNANDESGNGNNGAVIGPAITTDRFNNSNNAYFFANGIDYIYTTNQYLASNVLTYSIWFKLIGNGDGQVINFNNGQVNHGGMWCKSLFIGSSGITFFTFQGVNTSHTYNANYLDNNWHNCVVTMDATGSRIYVDAVLKSSDSNQNSGQIYEGYHRFGGLCPNDINNSLIGNYDDIGIWNRVLSQQEISSLYNAVNCSNNTTITPETNALATGSTATFNTTTSDPNPSYVWQSNLGQGYQTLNDLENYSGTNTSSLNIANVQLSEHNQLIRVITTSGECVDTSDIAKISILDTCVTSINDTTFVTVTDTLVINTLITGINPPNNSNTIKVFPNPANSHITIDYGNFVIMNGYQLKIENSLGQQVFQTNIIQQTDYLSLNNWGGNGLYFVHIIDAQGNTIDIRKIVLQ